MTVIVDSDKPSYKEPPKEIQFFSYKRINHFNEWLAQFQAKESTDIPDEVYNKILLEIKKEKISDASFLENINTEYSILKEQLEKNIQNDEKINELFKSLKEVNAKLWIIEDDKRTCEKNSDFSEKFIKLSRDVHFLNDKRARIKLEYKVLIVSFHNR